MLTRRVLLVDDVAEQAAPVSAALADCGLAVTLVADGAAALAAANEGYGLLVCDVDLPDAYGPELVGRLRRAGLGAPVIMVTCDPTPQVRADAHAAGALLCLAKALAPTVLAATVPPWLQRGGQVRQPADLDEMFDEQLYRHTQEMFARLLPERMDDIHRAESAGDPAPLAAAAHALAGPAGMVGMLGAAALCRSIQAEAQAGVIAAGLVRGLDELVAEASRYGIVSPEGECGGTVAEGTEAVCCPSRARRSA